MTRARLTRRWQLIQSDERQRLFKNTGLLLAATAFARLAGVITVALIGRRLGPDILGDYALGMAWAAIIFQIADMGLSVTLRREAARRPDDAPSLYSYLLPLFGVMMGLGLLAAFGTGKLFGYAAGTLWIVIGIAVISIVDRFAQFNMAVFDASEAMEYSASSILVRAVIIAVGVPLYLWYGGTIGGVLLVLLLAASIEMLFTHLLLARLYFRPRLRFNPRRWKAILLDSYPLAFSGIFVIIYYRVDTIMIQSMIGAAAAGYYNAAYALMGGFTMISVAFNRSMFAQFAQVDTRPQAVLKALNRGILWMGVAGGSIAVGLFLFATPLIRLLYGSSFVGESDVVLRVLGWTLLFMFMSSLCGSFLNASGHQQTSMRITAITATLNVVLNFLFIPRIGYVGAAITTILSYAFGLSAMYFYIRARVFANVSKGTA